ncbi:MAG: hypothetical protein ACWGMT_10270 [Burkholderiales bacterium]
MFGAADEVDPERHHLHIAASARARHCVLAEIALDLNDAEDELGVESGALGFIVYGDEEGLPCLPVRHSLFQPLRHCAQPVPRLCLGLKGEIGDGLVGNRLVQDRLHARGKGLVFLLAGGRCERKRHGKGKAPSQTGVSYVSHTLDFT